MRVVATSALRDARNSRAFLEWVRSTTGWDVEIISGLEEARLIHLGLVSTLRVNSSPVLMVDLGGGSCELTISSKGHIRNTVSLPLGAVRLTNEFLHHDPPRKSEMRQLRGFMSREIERIADRIKRARPKVVIATSGTAESLAAVCHGLYKTKGSRATTVSKTANAADCQDAGATASRRTQETFWSRSATRRDYCRRSGGLPWTPGALPAARDSAIPRWDCATDCWRRWRPNTTAPRAPESRSNLNAGIRSAPPSRTIEWTWTTPCRCVTRPCTCSPR